LATLVSRRGSKRREVKSSNPGSDSDAILIESLVFSSQGLD
jgi:hypothetical protein